jgi:hypothetical protein
MPCHAQAMALVDEEKLENRKYREAIDRVQAEICQRKAENREVCLAVMEHLVGLEDECVSLRSALQSLEAHASEKIEQVRNDDNQHILRRGTYSRFFFRIQIADKLQPVIAENLSLHKLNSKLERKIGELSRTLEQEKRNADEQVIS